MIVAIGEAPGKVFKDIGEMLGEPVPAVRSRPLETGEAMAWFRHTGEPPLLFTSVVPEPVSVVTATSIL